MWKQLAILCFCIPSVHHLKKKTVNLTVFWPIKIQADVAGISRGNIKDSLGRMYQHIDLVHGSDFLFTAAAVEMV